MSKIEISNSVVHKVPTDVRKILVLKPSILKVWEDITPFARNEWICWIEFAKKSETRDRRIRIMSENLLEWKRRPCCWVGCNHR